MNARPTSKAITSRARKPAKPSTVAADLDIVRAINHPELFEPWFRGATWDGWRTVLKAAYALPMTPAEVDFFRTVAERDPQEASPRTLDRGRAPRR